MQKSATESLVESFKLNTLANSLFDPTVKFGDQRTDFQNARGKQAAPQKDVGPP